VTIRVVDTLTHALSGALLARATASRDAPPKFLWRRMAAGFLACASPDLDIVIALFGPIAYLENHRGVTHSLVLLPLWALLYSWILAAILREPRGWRALYGITAMGLALHVAGDVITSYGTVILAPFSDWRAEIGTTFIIDLWFTGIIVAGLVASGLVRRARWPAAAALVVLAGYVGFQYAQKQEATEFGAATRARHGLRGASVNAQPRPVSPFNWTVFVSDAEVHRFADVNLVRETPPGYREGDGYIAMLDSVYQPLASARWETRARYGGGRGGRTRARSVEFSGDGGLSLVRRSSAYDGTSERSACVWFVDLRSRWRAAPPAPSATAPAATLRGRPGCSCRPLAARVADSR